MKTLDILEGKMKLTTSPYAFDVNPDYKKRQHSKTTYRLFAKDHYERKQMRKIVKALQKSGMFRLKRRKIISGKTMWEFKKL